MSLINKGYEQVYSMYTWLIEKVNDDCNRTNNKDYEIFHEEYEKTLEMLKSEREKLKINSKILNFNNDSVQRITEIVRITKEEYGAVYEENTDLEQLNYMIGWYESIVKETNMFIESLYDKQ